jgi:N-acetylmuramoyl-L-alanine amidase
MKSTEEAAVLTSADWRARYAAAVTRGTAAYLSSTA